MEKPAAAGGNPVRETKLYYGHQYIDETDVQAVSEVLRNGDLTCGPKVNALEKRLCELTGAKYAVVCSNGTAALHIAALAAGLGEGDELITTPITFAASANCALYCGAKPVFADINPRTYNIDPKCVREKITDRTKAVVAVDYTGQAVELDALLALCREKGLLLIEDAAHSIGTKYNGKPVGSIADLTTFSFHPVKTVTGGEGGAVLTNSAQLYEKLLLYRSHGITRKDDLLERKPHGAWYYEQIDLGYNYRITDIQCALILSQLDKLSLFSQRRKEIVEQYNKAFLSCPELFVQEEIPASDTTRHLYILRIVPEKINNRPQRLFLKRWLRKISAAMSIISLFTGIHIMKSWDIRRGICPHAEKLYTEMMSLPLYYGLTDKDVEDVITAVKKLWHIIGNS